MGKGVWNGGFILNAVALMASAVASPSSYAVTADSTGKAPNTRLQEITVEGHREALRRELNHFVDHVTRPDFLERSLARWLEPVCPAAMGLPRDQGEYLLARVSTIADAAKAPLSKDSDCAPNLYIMFTHDPKKSLEGALKKDPFLLRVNGELAGPRAVSAFLDTPVPVRVWYNTGRYRTAGRPPLTEAVSLPNGQTLGTETDIQIGSPKMWYAAVEGLDTVIVIVDTSLTKGMSLATVVDYTAMVGLMELEPDAKVGNAPSILAAFSGGTGRATAMTEWDGAFLKGLYETEQFSHGQRGLIVDRMMAQVAK
jgi:hypothetical protein